jgi:hypothetical protein
VTHNHRRDTLLALRQDSDAWMTRMAATPQAVLQALVMPASQLLKQAA